MISYALNYFSLPCQGPKREHPIDSQFDWPIEEFLNKVKRKGVSTPHFTSQDKACLMLF